MSLSDKFKRKTDSFLPEDYIAKRTERRANLIAIVLFVVVTFGVVGAFFVTNREWNDVREYQRQVNLRYAQAAEDLEQLKVLEESEAQLRDEAELTLALKQRIPRSTLLAELINRIPSRMPLASRPRLIDFELKSQRSDRTVKSRTKSSDKGSDSKKKRSAKSKSSKDKDDEKEKMIVVPHYAAHITLRGAAKRNQDVAQFLSGLEQCRLLNDVRLVSTEQKNGKSGTHVEFLITASIDPEADLHTMDPTYLERSDDPLAMNIDLPPTAGEVTDVPFYPDLSNTIDSYDGGVHYEDESGPVNDEGGL